jgi:hypothetical protein
MSDEVTLDSLSALYDETLTALAMLAGPGVRVAQALLMLEHPPPKSRAIIRPEVKREWLVLLVAQLNGIAWASVGMKSRTVEKARVVARLDRIVKRASSMLRRLPAGHRRGSTGLMPGEVDRLPAVKERRGINPFTKEPIVIPARPRKKAARAPASPAKRKRPAKKAAPRKGKKAAKKGKKAAKKAAVRRPAPWKRRPPRKPAPQLATIETVSTPPEPVFLGVAAPRTARREGTFIARFAAYVRALEVETEKQLKAMADVDSATGFEPVGAATWAIGAKVTVRVTGVHFTPTPEFQTFEWDGRRRMVHFQVKVDDGAPPGPTPLCFEAYIEGFCVALIPVDVTIGATTSKRSRSVHAPAPQTAFASYASKDQDEVMGRISALSAANRGLDIYVDHFELHAGDDWKAELAQAISKRELFYLFWSRAAKRSKWVDWEWRQALAAKKGIQPIPIEQAAAPPELAHLHFSNKFLPPKPSRKAPRVDQ